MASTAGVFTPYSTSAPLFGTKPTWITNELDIERIQSYQLYEQIYWTVPDVFKVQLRGTNDLTIYVPNARTIVDTTNRFTGVDFGVRITDMTNPGTSTPDVLAARAAWTAFMRRERFMSRFNGAKRYNLIRGDWIWHLTGDATKPQGSRLSLVALDPSMYFPITDDDDVDVVIGCHLVEQIDVDGTTYIHRLTYRKEGADIGKPTGFITVEDALFPVDKWEGPTAKPSKVLSPPTRLPAQITALPVYHVKNFEEPGNPFGSSEIRGLERLMSAVDQTISDEDLTLAMQGIGMYWTDAPDPTDPTTGEVVPWQLGPGQVVTVPEGNQFGRLDGVKSVLPFGDHIGRLRNFLMEASATPEIAIGRVDAKVASGIALALDLQPMLAKSGEKNTHLIDVHNQMMYDLFTGWFPAYEGQTFNNIDVSCYVGTGVPVDRAAKQAELDSMLEHKVIDAAYYRSEMEKLGYVFPDNIQQRIDQAAAADAANQATAFGADRVNTELNSPPAN